MARIRDLRNPPIAEAVVDIIVRFAQPVEPSRLAELHADIIADYPTQEARGSFQFQITGGGAGAAPGFRTSAVSMGCLFRSADQSRAIQSKPDGFTFSQLRPYRGWDVVSAEAMRYWQMYRERFSPERVSRVSVRYINRMVFPGTMIDFDEYVIGAPQIPDDLPQQVAEFKNEYLLPELAPRTVGRLRLAFNAAECTPAGAPVLLDIDVLRECDVDPGNDAAIVDSLRDLRALKNVLFFGTVTEKAIGVFE